jgi:1-hydroxy-2-naphthoate dioxygenase
MIQENFTAPQQPVEKPESFSAKLFAHARPRWIENTFEAPPYRYSWEETNASLQALKQTAGDAYDGIILEYANPVTGGHTLPTCSCSIQLLRPHEKTKTHRHTSTTVYYAFRGRGMTRVSANEFNWEKSDIFVVPSWQWHSHENSGADDAILFSISDRPSTEALGLYREEAQ